MCGWGRIDSWGSRSALISVLTSSHVTSPASPRWSVLSQTLTFPAPIPRMISFTQTHKGRYHYKLDMSLGWGTHCWGMPSVSSAEQQSCSSKYLWTCEWTFSHYQPWFHNSSLIGKHTYMCLRGERIWVRDQADKESTLQEGWLCSSGTKSTREAPAPWNITGDAEEEEGKKRPRWTHASTMLVVKATTHRGDGISNHVGGFTGHYHFSPGISWYHRSCHVHLLKDEREEEHEEKEWGKLWCANRRRQSIAYI